MSHSTVTGRRPVLPGWPPGPPPWPTPPPQAVVTLAPIRVLLNTLGTALGFLAWRLAAGRQA